MGKKLVLTDIEINNFGKKNFIACCSRFFHLDISFFGKKMFFTDNVYTYTKWKSMGKIKCYIL